MGDRIGNRGKDTAKGQQNFHLSQKMSQRVCEKQMWMTSQTPIHEEKIKREFTDHCIFFVFIGMSQEH